MTGYRTVMYGRRMSIRAENAPAGRLNETFGLLSALVGEEGAKALVQGEIRRRLAFDGAPSVMDLARGLWREAHSQDGAER